MEKAKKRGWNIRATAGKIVIGLVMASMVGGLSALPAFGDDHRRRPDRDRYERRGDDRNRHERWRDDRDRRERRRHGRDAYYYHRRVHRHYVPAPPVYVPPPVVFEPPPPPPGINIFFPPIRIH